MSQMKRNIAYWVYLPEQYDQWFCPVSCIVRMRLKSVLDVKSLKKLTLKIAVDRKEDVEKAVNAQWSNRIDDSWDTSLPLPPLEEGNAKLKVFRGIEGSPWKERRVFLGEQSPFTLELVFTRMSCAMHFSLLDALTAPFLDSLQITMTSQTIDESCKWHVWYILEN